MRSASPAAQRPEEEILNVPRQLGKIMRRILRKIAENELSSLGDTSTLADPAVVDALVAGRKQTH